MAVLSAVGVKVWLLHLKFSRGLSLNVIREVCSYLPSLLLFGARGWSYMTSTVTKAQSIRYLLT